MPHGAWTFRAFPFTKVLGRTLKSGKSVGKFALLLIFNFKSNLFLMPQLSVSKKECKKCGHQIDEHAIVCPWCGYNERTGESPNTAKGESNQRRTTESKSKQDETVLYKGKSTEAESMITDYAESIRSWGQILAWVALIFVFIGSIVAGGSSDAPGLMLVGIIVAVINFVIILFITKLIWASIMLFVNISTTLKRMEITLNQLNHKS